MKFLATLRNGTVLYKCQSEFALCFAVCRSVLLTLAHPQQFFGGLINAEERNQAQASG